MLTNTAKVASTMPKKFWTTNRELKFYKVFFASKNYQIAKDLALTTLLSNSQLDLFLKGLAKAYKAKLDLYCTTIAIK